MANMALCSFGLFKPILTCLSVTTVIILQISVLVLLNSQGVHGNEVNTVVGSKASHATSSDGVSGSGSGRISGEREDFCRGQSWCSNMSDNEKLALDAIRHLHGQLDDDQNGSIDLKESNGFLREELNYQKGDDKRHKNFHRNNDNQISVQNLWELWVSSEVHNWTTQQTVDWLTINVGLPQYESAFVEKSINGSYLPRLAANQHHFLSHYIGIKESRHKQKVLLKAQDAVLFGAPKEYRNSTKDIVLTSLLAVAVTVIWIVYRRYQVSQRDLTKMSKELESLFKAEEALKTMQDELDKTKVHDSDPGSDASVGYGENSPDQAEELSRLKAESEYLRSLLQNAEDELKDKCWLPPPHLRNLLLLTYQLETKSYNNKKKGAETQLKQARDACNKLKEKRSSIIHAFVAANSRVVDEVDKAIVEAKTSLQEVTYELRERMGRWKQIESLTNFLIINNPGITGADSINRTSSFGRTSSTGSTRSSRPMSILHDSNESLHDDGRN